MTEKQDLELKLNTTLWVIGVQIKALKATLTPKQFEKYSQIIEAEKEAHLNEWGEVLTPEQFAELSRVLN
ncbi:MAG: hypothetical protein ACLGH8_02100 [Bacteroidia bacterium]